MPITISSRELNQDTGRAKRAARSGPVFITERGQASFVLLNMTDYQRLTGAGPSLADLLGDHDAAEIEFDLPPRTVAPVRDIGLDDDPG